MEPIRAIITTEKRLSSNVIEHIDDIAAEDWDRLNTSKNPFLQHAFLASFERSHCAHIDSGWQPQHIICKRGDTLVGALPLYLKSHSYGEFVFDWSWAEAYHRSGLEYYPKLISAIPFTPATGPRLLAENNDPAIQQHLQQTTLQLAKKRGVSSIHILFSDEKEKDNWLKQGFLQRTDCQFHWKNNNYTNFDDFIGTFTAKRRKETRRERRIANQDITIKLFRGEYITAQHWDLAFEFYQNHALEKGGTAYLNKACFEHWAQYCAESTLLLLAYRQEEAVAGALFFIGGSTLYGRYWGLKEYIPCLHFELCYYRPIEFCIEHGIERFEAGAQGEHKLGRGLTPTTTYSAHWIAQPQFRQAIAHYLGHEKQGVDQYIQHAETLTPQRKQSS